MEEVEVYTYEQWGKDGTFKAKSGQIVDDRVFNQMLNCVPPLHYEYNYMQVGEPYGYDFERHKTTFTTFVKEERGWMFVGEFPNGEGRPKPKTFEDLKFKDESKWIKSARMSFPNGYGISVVCGDLTTSDGVDTYEVGVLRNGQLYYDSPITNDVLVHQTASEVTEIMKRIQDLWFPWSRF